MNNFTPNARRTDANMNLNQTNSSAGGVKPTGPSPYLAQFVRSNYKATGGPSLNDSLDKLKLEFMQGYNDVMAESDAAYRLESKKQSNARGGGALN